MTRVLTTSSETLVEQDKVIAFRYEWLFYSGYRRRNAEKIANDLSIDWHFAVDLRKKCTDEKLCMRILFGSDGP